MVAHCSNVVAHSGDVVTHCDGNWGYVIAHKRDLVVHQRQGPSISSLMCWVDVYY